MSKKKKEDTGLHGLIRAYSLGRMDWVLNTFFDINKALIAKLWWNFRTSIGSL